MYQQAHRLIEERSTATTPDISVTVHPDVKKESYVNDYDHLYLWFYMYFYIRSLSELIGNVIIIA